MSESATLDTNHMAVREQRSDEHTDEGSASPSEGKPSPDLLAKAQSIDEDDGPMENGDNGEESNSSSSSSSSDGAQPSTSELSADKLNDIPIVRVSFCALFRFLTNFRFFRVVRIV